MIEEIFIENVTHPKKTVKTKETNYEFPWLLLIICGAGLLLIAGGAVTAFVIVEKKKANKNSL